MLILKNCHLLCDPILFYFFRMHVLIYFPLPVSLNQAVVKKNYIKKPCDSTCQLYSRLKTFFLYSLILQDIL